MHKLASLTRSFSKRIAALAVMTLFAAGHAFGQTPSPEQIEAFKNLPPEQQQTILEGMGGNAKGSVQRDDDLASPETTRPRPVNGVETQPTARSNSGDGRQLLKELRISGLDTVLLDVKLVEKAEDAPPLRPEEKLRIDAMRDRLLRGNPYKLDANGTLRIPGVAPIPLAGLTAPQATERVSLDPAMRDFAIKVSVLPLQKLDTEALKPFGYDLFAGSPSTFAPVTDVPVPSQYVVGPGDRFEVQLIGNTKGRYSLTVNRDGRIMFPELGPIAVVGVGFDEARARIERRVSEQMIGTQAIVTMGDLRSIRVFVLGEAEQPGSYTVSGLSTVTNALLASGGVKPIGSLRNIQLKRNGKVVARLDLYDLLLKGNTPQDVRVQPGDVIFIPPVGPTVSVTGEIRRPAIYELNGEATVSDLVALGGGLTPEADGKLARLERIDERRDRIVLGADLSSPSARTMRLRSGDLLRIPAARPSYASAVQLQGHVYRAGTMQYREGMRLSDLLPSVDELKPNADMHYVLIRREDSGSRRVSALSADLQEAWRAPSSDANPVLRPRDQITVFDTAMGRSQYMTPLIEELKQQATSDAPTRLVRVAGSVRAEGEYPLEPGMTVTDLVRAAGGLAEQAFADEAELARYDVRDGSTRRSQILKVSLQRALVGDPSADLLLAPFDTLVVKQIPEWSEREIVHLEGEVRFPGDYPIARGETIRSLIARGGGLTPLGYSKGSVFTREYLKERERQQIKVLTDRMRQDLGVLALQASQAGGSAAAQASESLAVGQSLLRDLQAAEPVGRLVIDLDRVMAAAPGSNDDVVLRDGDRLRVPKRLQEVTVLGEVQNATSHLFDPGLTRDDYLRLSGGATKKADEKRIYVVRANGSVEAGSGSSWFRESGSGIQPGDTIVVPLNAEKMRPLPLWTAVTTIIYNLSVAVAAIGSL